MVCGAGEADRYLKPVLDQWVTMVDDAVICLNNADRKTKKLVDKYGYWYYNDDREWGIHQPAIKTDLLHKIAGLKPDWILPLDADEIYDPEFTRERAEELANRGEIGWRFAIINLWNDQEHYRKHLTFWNVRFFQFRPELGLIYAKKNLHCGLAPPIFYDRGGFAPFYILHYGLMKPEDRQMKTERYEKYDPNGKWKSKELYYDELKRETVGSPFNAGEFKSKLLEDQKHYAKSAQR